MNTALYKKRKIRCVQNILAMEQMCDIGKLVNSKSLRNSVELFMDPSQFFLISKPNLSKIHKYLLEHQLTTEKLASSHIAVGDHARLIIEILYPGYSCGKAREIAFKEERLGPKRKDRIHLAYDQLAISDLYERRDEVLKIKLDGREKGTIMSIELSSLKMAKAAKECKKSPHNMRLHLYMWQSTRMVYLPTLESFEIKDKVLWTKEDEKCLEEGCPYIDITDKVDWEALQQAKTSDIAVKFVFLEDIPNLEYISVCMTWKKSAEELVSQSYIHSATTLIARAMESTRDFNLVQRKAVAILGKYPVKERSDINKAQEIYLLCADAFSDAWIQLPAENDDDDVKVENEVVSVLDPIMISRQQHPARGIYCTHVVCFEATSFYNVMTRLKVWTCPHCFVQIKGAQDIYIDYAMTRALLKFPQAERMMLCGKEYLPDTETSAEWLTKLEACSPDQGSICSESLSSMESSTEVSSLSYKNERQEIYLEDAPSPKRPRHMTEYIDIS
ncbi:hypothetical protein BDF14DRAFT_1774413 [Spinellus fusiger]|nr:hypothetical protein BDF14DRAFT_1774413 [Spinellus fusiger]